MMLPKTIVLAINIHGGSDSIDLLNSPNKKTYPVTKVPQQIKKFIKIDGVPWGNDIVICSNEVGQYIKIIKDELYSIHFANANANTTLSIPIDNFVEKTTREIKSLCFNRYKSKKNFNLYKTKSEDINDYDKVKQYSNYLQCIRTKNIYKINNFLSDEFVVDKVFCYEKKKYSNKVNQYVGKIDVLNIGFDHIDLFDLMESLGLCKPYQSDGLEIKLSEMLEFLVTQQVENIIMFDFTCASLFPEEIFTPRDIRRFRREIYYGLSRKRPIENKPVENKPVENKLNYIESNNLESNNLESGNKKIKISETLFLSDLTFF